MREEALDHRGLFDRSPQFGVRRQHPMKADEMQARARHQCCQPPHEFQRRHHEVARAVEYRCDGIER